MRTAPTTKLPSTVPPNTALLTIVPTIRLTAPARPFTTLSACFTIRPTRRPPKAKGKERREGKAAEEDVENRGLGSCGCGSKCS